MSASILASVASGFLAMASILQFVVSAFPPHPLSHSINLTDLGVQLFIGDQSVLPLDLLCARLGHPDRRPGRLVADSPQPNFTAGPRRVRAASPGRPRGCAFISPCDAACSSKKSCPSTSLMLAGRFLGSFATNPDSKSFTVIFSHSSRSVEYLALRKERPQGQSVCTGAGPPLWFSA